MDIQALAAGLVRDIRAKIERSLDPLRRAVDDTNQRVELLDAGLIAITDSQKEHAAAQAEANAQLVSEIAAHAFDWDELTRELDDA